MEISNYKKYYIKNQKIMKISENMAKIVKISENKLKIVKTGWTPRRDKGEGRPTKKDRRAMDELHDI